MAQNIPVEIIFCCYNQEQYIAKAIESILIQDATGLDVRVIVADDCSPDKTLEIIKSYEGKSRFPFTYLLDEHNLGLNRNYERAFKACTRKYVAVLEGDDWWSSPMHLQQHIRFLEKHSSYSMSFNRMDIYTPQNETHNCGSWNLKRNYVKITLKNQIINGNFFGNLSASMFRGCCLKTLPESFFNLNFADFDLGIWVMQFGPAGYLKDCTSIYRFNGEGLWSSTGKAEREKSIITTLDSMSELMPNRYNRLFQKAKKRIESGAPQDFSVFNT